MISVIIPVYNQAKKLLLTLKSLAGQSYSDYEVIIVNDGSTDGVEKVFSDYYAAMSASQAYLFLNQKHAGAPAARNRGLKAAKGEYLFFCDADAVLEKSALETMLKALSDNLSVSYVYSSFKWGRKLFRLGEFDPEKLKRQPYIHTMSLIRRVDFPASGWDENLKKFQDWDLWLTFLEEGKIGLWLPKTLFTIAPGGRISAWLPKFAYRLLPLLPAVRKYKEALAIVCNKHGLS